MPSNPDTPETTGCLYVVATPIGNLDDISLRALRVLAEADLIAAEDTRHTRKLLGAHGITNRLISCHEHNEDRRVDDLLQRMRRGQCLALVSNAGTPAVSDPGYRLVRAAAADGIRVIPIPGVCAAATALSASGLATDQFTFIGFPPRKKSKRLELLRGCVDLPGTLIVYQSPQRILAFLDEAVACLGDRQAVLGREMTKKHEEFVRGQLTDIKAALSERDSVKGECTLLIAPARQRTEPAQADVENMLRDAIAARAGSLSAIAGDVARRTGLPRGQVYDKALAIKKESDR